MKDSKYSIHSFRDLEVYQLSYRCCLVVHRQIISRLPQNERYDLVDQLSRSSKAVPRLIAEGYSKKHQKAGFQKYLDDAHAEANETIVGLEQCRDLYNMDSLLCCQLADDYDKIARQLYKLAQVWTSFKDRGRLPPAA